MSREIWNAIKDGTEPVEIAGVLIHPWRAFTRDRRDPRDNAPWPLAWWDDLINRAILEMGEEYIGLFIDCRFFPNLFFHCIENEDWREAIKAAAKERKD